MEISVPPACLKAGFKPPPGLGFEHIGSDNVMLPAKKNRAVLESCGVNFVPGCSTRLSSRATPFQPRLDGPATGCHLFGDPSHLRTALSQYPVPEDGGAAINLGELTQECVQHLIECPSQEADDLMGASDNLQKTLVQLKGALQEWEPSVPEVTEQELSLDNLQQTLAHLKGSLAELEPSMSESNEKDMQLDKPAQDLQQTLLQLKGALADWKPSSESSEDDECSSQGSISSRFNSQASSHGSTKSGSSKNSNSSKGSKSTSSKVSWSKHGSSSSSSRDAYAANPLNLLDVAIAAAATPVMGAYSYQPEFNPNLAMMWGPQSLHFSQPAWQCGWPSLGAESWTDPNLPVPVSISDCLKDEFRDNSYDLKRIDPSFILCVRKIYRLGLESGAWLKAYFGKYGVVDKVLVGNSRSRRNSAGCMGFVVMSTVADVQAILRAGAEHVINGVCVTVRPYKGKASEDSNKERAPSSEMAFQ